MVATIVNDSGSIFGIGVDQGIANCGYAVVELTPNDDILIHTSGTIITSSKHELSNRISLIYKTINHLSKEYNVSILGCEKLFFSPKQKSDSNKKGRNKSASIVYTNMATGVLYLIAGQNNLHLKEFVPGTVKKYVSGHGKATKDEVAEAVKLLVKGLDKELKTEHEADAIAIAITAVRFKKDLMSKGLEREIKPNRKKSKKASQKEIQEPVFIEIVEPEPTKVILEIVINKPLEKQKEQRKG